MKRFSSICLIIGLIGMLGCVDREPDLKSPYLGQTPPGTSLEIFANGIVTTEQSESSIDISPDLKEVYFLRKSPKLADNRIWTSRVENGVLTQPQVASFSSDSVEGYPCFSPDGDRLYYVSRRPAPGQDTASVSVWGNIWYVDRERDGWGKPQLLDSPINDLHPHALSMDDQGTLYLGSALKSVYYAELTNGNYTKAVKLPDTINRFESVSHPAIAPDGSYLITDVYWRENDRVMGSLFISFKKSDGSWTQSQDMREALGIDDDSIWCCASVTPDGKILFVERYNQETSQSDLFWISSEIIQELKREGLKETS